jgi:phosphoglycerate dehydrogenase-like enzyme
MRIHIQNHPRQPVVFLVTPEHWAEAAARAGAAGEGHAVSFGASEAEFAAVAAEVEVLVTGPAALKHLLPALQPERAPALRLIFSTSAGVDGLAAAEMPAVPFANNRGAHAEKAGEFVIMALLMLANGMPAFIEDQKNRHWAQRFTRGLRGRRLTVLGLGAMGGAAAEQAAHFGMRVTGIRATPRPHPACERVLGMEALDEVLPETDFLLLSCPLTEATRRILDRRRIRLLPPSAGVINIGRGPLIEQAALCDALDAGVLAGAVLDVFDPEPVPSDDRIWRTSNMIMTPHVSVDDAVSYIPRSLDIFFANLEAFRRGEPLLTPVDFSRGY